MLPTLDFDVKTRYLRSVGSFSGASDARFGSKNTVLRLSLGVPAVLPTLDFDVKTQ